MKWFQLPTFALLVLLLTACPAAGTPNPGPDPNPDPGPAPEETVTRAGIVSFSEISGAGSEEPLRGGSASFFTVPETPASDYDDLTPDDLCVVVQNSPNEEPPTGEPGEEATFLDAGEQITATSAGEPYAVLEKTEQDGNVVYSTDFEQNLPPLPSSAFTVEGTRRGLSGLYRGRAWSAGRARADQPGRPYEHHPDEHL